MLVITACIVAIIDGVAAVMITFALYGRSPVSVFQYIASGLLGSPAFSGGLSTAFVGLIFHFFIASYGRFSFSFYIDRHPASCGTGR